jgi:hypothetical protein
VLRGIWTKLKAVLRLAAIGAGVGAIVGGAWFVVAGLLNGVVVPGAVANAAVVYGSFGFFTTSGLALVLANARAKASLDDVGVAWSGLIGAAAGAAFPLVFNIVMLQSLLPLRLIEGLLPIMGALGLFGGVWTAGMVAAAKLEHRKELESAVEPQLLRE